MGKSCREYTLAFKIMSDETRLKIIDMLSGRELCACHLLERVPVSQPTLSYHMRMLCDSGLVTGKKDGQRVRYTLNREKLRQTAAFLLELCDRPPDEKMRNSAPRP